MNLILSKRTPYKTDKCVEGLQAIGEVELHDYETHIEVEIDLAKSNHSAYVENDQCQELRIIDNNAPSKSVLVMAIPLSIINLIKSL